MALEKLEIDLGGDQAVHLAPIDDGYMKLSIIHPKGDGEPSPDDHQPTDQQEDDLLMTYAYLDDDELKAIMLYLARWLLQPMMERLDAKYGEVVKHLLETMKNEKTKGGA